MSFTSRRDLLEFLRQQGKEVVVKESLVKEAEAILQLFHKVLKAFKLYPLDNPLFKRFTEQFLARMRLIHQEIPVIPFRIKKTGFLFANVALKTLSDEQMVAFILFNDGIREIYFQRGVTAEDLIEFLNILWKVTVFVSEEYDLATLLWDADFKHIGYVTEEELMEAEAIDEYDFEQIYDLSAAHTAKMATLEEKRFLEDLSTVVKKIAFVNDDEKAKFSKLLAEANQQQILARFV